MVTAPSTVAPGDPARREPPAHGPGRAAAARWTVALLGRLEAGDGTQVLQRFGSRAAALLLARLALAPQRSHAREELIELLWPGVSLSVGRNRLRQTLSTLKGMLEPVSERDHVLHADRYAVRVHAGALDCDVLAFERLARAGRTAEAHALYRGELMPGFYEDWVHEERRRVAALFERIDAAVQGATPPPPPSAIARATAPPHAITADDATVAPAASRLPSYWTRAFGNELSATRLHALVLGQRLVTVHGAGGSGKTRLAVEVARALLEGVSPPRDDDDNGATPPFDRVVFVSLVDCRDAPALLEALCAALQAAGEGPARPRIEAALEGRRVLLVLDNLEQLDDAAVAEIPRLLAAAPLLHMLATSQRLLGIDGEHAFALEGLALPAADASPQEAAASPAVALFVDRARAARADFRLGARNAAALAALTRLLGGQPLAIELAASRMRGLTPQQLVQRLGEGVGTPTLDLLARGHARSGHEGRHASMRSVVEWSWRQLAAPPKALLAAMAVLAAPAPAGAVAAAAGVTPRRAQALLDELCDTSLVRALPQEGDGPRYALLQPVREFAAEHLDAARARAARQRLRLWLLRFLQQASALGPDAPADVPAELLQLAAAAIVSAPADGAAGDALRLGAALRPHWDRDAPTLSLLAALEAALAAAHDADDALRCAVHEGLALGRGLAGFGDEAIAHAERAVAAAPGDRQRSLALSRLAWARYTAGQFDAALDATLAEARCAAERSGDLLAQALALRTESLVVCNIKFDFAGTEALSARAQALFEQLGNRPLAYLSLLNRAMMWGKTGHGNAQAIEVIAECERAARAGGDWSGLIMTARQLGRVYIRERRWDEAAAALRRSVRVAWQRHSVQGVAHGLLHLPMALVMRGQAEAAAGLLGFALPHWQRLFHGINAIEARELRRTQRMLVRSLGRARAEALRIEGAGLAKADAVALALDESAA